MSPRIGLLVGRERSFPEALAAEVKRRAPGAVCELATLSAPRADAPPPWDVLVDRISHEVVGYQPWLKLAAMYGTRVVNNPFWRIADDKFFNAGLASALGVAVPRTVLLPSKSYGDDTTADSLRNLRLVDWDAVERELGGYPLFLKPHWGGGWRDVSRVRSREELSRAYDASGRLVMIAQESIEWTQYVRCVVIGREAVLPALWDPRLSHFDRYRFARETMPPLDAALEERVRRDALTITRALGYDMNTVELAVRDGVPYAVDYMNSAPDFDVSSLGDEHFAWVIDAMATLVLRLASEPARPALAWDGLLTGRAT